MECEVAGSNPPLSLTLTLTLTLTLALALTSTVATWNKDRIRASERSTFFTANSVLPFASYTDACGKMVLSPYGHVYIDSTIYVLYRQYYIDMVLLPNCLQPVLSSGGLGAAYRPLDHSSRVG